MQAQSVSIEAGTGNTNTGLWGEEARITGGWQEDIDISISAGGYAMRDGAEINIFGGNDSVILNGKLSGLTADVAVSMDNGDDFLRLEYGTANLIEGEVHLDGGNHTGTIGDVLSLGYAQSMDYALGGIGNANITGFETLHLDFTSEDMDILDIDDRLADVAQAGFSGEDAFANIIITGDDEDSGAPDLLFMNSATLEESGVALDHGGKAFEGQTFDHYSTYDSNNDLIDVYVATGLWAM